MNTDKASFKLSPENEKKRQQALKRVEDAYQDKSSPHYRDNERFSWAVETINRKFFEDCVNEP